MCHVSERGKEFDADSHDGLAGRRIEKLRRQEGIRLAGSKAFVLSHEGRLSPWQMGWL